MKKLVIEDMNVTIKLDGCFTYIIGPTSSGKTTLLKRIINVIPSREVRIDTKNINEFDISFKKINIVCVLDDNNYEYDTIYDFLISNLTQLKFDKEEIDNRIKEITKTFKLNKMLDDKIEDLTLEYKNLVKILSYLIINPIILGIDNLLDYLSEDNYKNIIKYVKRKHISLIAITSNMERLLDSDNIIIMNDYKCILRGDTEETLLSNNILPFIGFRLPFAIDLSQNLILYGLVDKVYSDKRKLVDKIWK